MPTSAKFRENSNLQQLRSSKVDDFGTNGKRICDFLLVINSNFGPNLHRFRDHTPPLFGAPAPYPPFGISRWG